MQNIVGTSTKRDTGDAPQLSSVLASTLFLSCLFFLGALLPTHGQAAAADPRNERIEQLEKMIRQLADEVHELKKEAEEERAETLKRDEQVSTLSARVEEMSDSTFLNPDSWIQRFHLGGYGEMHANFGEGDTPDQFDIHRLVAYIGYDFADWIKFNSEIEMEHAYVSEDSDGELSVEQAYVDFVLWDQFNVRVGRILTPLGIINKKHEPPTFYGVERPSFEKYIIPTTWSSDGIGFFGRLSPSLSYEAYVVAGLDGSKFDDTNGIRNGRIKERPSLHDVAGTARIDFYPFAEHAVPYGQLLRLGLSTYFGGIDNGNKGKNPGISGDISIYSGDVEYTLSDFDFRGVIAFQEIDGAREIGNGTAEEIFGWYLEGAYRFWPDSWKIGKLARSDAGVFVRYDVYDTQHSMPSGVARNPAGDRNEWTSGLNFYPIPNFVLKADVQFRDDDTGEDLDTLFNLGVGWQF